MIRSLLTITISVTAVILAHLGYLDASSRGAVEVTVNVTQMCSPRCTLYKNKPLEITNSRGLGLPSQFKALVRPVDAHSYTGKIIYE